jgi:hypothetical protein
MGALGRERVRQHWSLDAMVAGYEQLIERIYRAKTAAANNGTCVADLAPRPVRRAFR